MLGPDLRGSLSVFIGLNVVSKVLIALCLHYVCTTMKVVLALLQEMTMVALNASPYFTLISLLLQGWTDGASLDGDAILAAEAAQPLFERVSNTKTHMCRCVYIYIYRYL